MNTSRLEIHDRSKDYLESLIHALDALLFLLLGLIYLGDNLTFFLLLRAINQVLHVQHRAHTAQLPPVIAVNALSIGTHLLQQPNLESKYRHGGLLVDFVGELPPSKWKLISLDLVVLALQMVMLVADHEKNTKSNGEPDGQPNGPAEQETPVRTGYEAEVDIEMQNLRPDQRDVGEAIDASSSDAIEEPLIVLNMRRGLREILKRPAVSAATTIEDPETRAGLANVLARIASARARAENG